MKKILILLLLAILMAGCGEQAGTKRGTAYSQTLIDNSKMYFGTSNDSWVEFDGTDAQFETTGGGIFLNADGATAGDIDIDSADDTTITVAGDLTFAVTGTLTAGGSAITNQLAVVEEITAQTDTLTAAESGKLIVGDYTGAQTITLPDAAAGLFFGFVDSSATAGDDLIIDCSAADTIDGDTAGDAIESVTDALGQTIWLVAIDGTQWITYNRSGTWGAQ